MHHLVAGRDEGPRRDPRAVPPRDRPRADDPRRARRRGARDDQGAHARAAFDGVSMRYELDDADGPGRRARRSSTRCSAHAAIWHDGWKAVTTHPTITGWGNFNDDEWELYHTDVDRSELHNLAAEHPDKLRELVNLWFAEAGANGGVPARRPFGARDHVDAAPAADRAARPLRLLPRTRAEVPESQAVNVRNRSFAIGALVDIPDARRRGRALRPRARASAATPSTSRTTGCTTSTTSSAWSSRRSSATEDIPTGENLILSASFDKDGEDPPASRPACSRSATATTKVGEGADQDPAGQVHDRRRGPLRRPRRRRPRSPTTTRASGRWRFTGGTIHRVAVDVSGEPYIDLEREAQAMLMRE